MCLITQRCRTIPTNYTLLRIFFFLYVNDGGYRALTFCTTKRNGEFQVGRKTSKKRLVKQIAAVQSSLRQRLHHPPLTTPLRWLESVLRGHMNYYGVPGNISSVSVFRTEIIRRWFKMQRRRSQRKAIVWSWFSGWINRNCLMRKLYTHTLVNASMPNTLCRSRMR